MAQLYLPGQLTPDHVTAVGAVVIEWSRFENLLQQTFWILSRLETRQGRCITQYMSFFSLWNAIKSLALEVQVSEDTSNNLDEIFNECDALRIKRNNFVHSIWGGSPESKNAGEGEATAITIKARNYLEIKHQNIHVDDIADVRSRISTVSVKIGDFNQRLKEEVNTL